MREEEERERSRDRMNETHNIQIDRPRIEQVNEVPKRVGV